VRVGENAIEEIAFQETYVKVFLLNTTSERSLKVAGKQIPVQSIKRHGSVKTLPNVRRLDAIGSLPIAQTSCHW
jgi:hypothetical protein